MKYSRPLLWIAGIALAGLVVIVGAFYYLTSGKVIATYPGSAPNPSMHVLFLAGRDSHGEGEHEHRAGIERLDAALRQANGGISTTLVYGGWPSDESVFEGIDALVMYCDGGPFHPINRNVALFNELVANNVGVVALHYCVETTKGSDSARAMLAATGGYFETGWSVNPHWVADYSALPEHSITAGVQPFSLLDEWYFNMRFTQNLKRIQPILRAIPPPATMARENGPHSGNDHVRQLVAAEIPQITAWAYERPGGGRGFGFTGGHFHANWDNDNMRTIVVNAIEWVASGRTADAN